MAGNQRKQKLADQIQREVSDLVQRELRDPRIGLVTITGVEVSADSARATVFFTCLDAAQAPRAAEGLNRAAGFLRSKMARRIASYSTPQLRFRYDESVQRGAHLSNLIDTLSRDAKD